MGSTEQLITIGILCGVVVIGFFSFWSGLSGNTTYNSTSYTDVTAVNRFKNITSTSDNTKNLVAQFKDTFDQEKNKDPATFIWSLLTLLAGTLYSALKILFNIPIMLVDIFLSAVSVIGEYISIGPLVAAVAVILVIKALFIILDTVGAMKK